MQVTYAKAKDTVRTYNITLSLGSKDEFLIVTWIMYFMNWDVRVHMPFQQRLDSGIKRTDERATFLGH